MQPVSGGPTPPAGASTTLPRTSPNQANLTASQQYASLPLQASIPKTQASQSSMTDKMENTPSATSQLSVPTYASEMDGAPTQPLQSNASPAKFATLPTQSTFINQGSYPAAVPATVHYAVQVPNYGIPPLPQTAPPPPPHISFPPFTEQSYTGHIPPSVPLPNYSTFPTETGAANKVNPLNSLQIGYSATGSLPFPPPSVTFSSSTGAGPSFTQAQYRQYSTFLPSTTTSSTEGTVPPPSHSLYSQYSTLPPSTTTSATKGALPSPSHTLYSQYSTLPPSTSTSSIEGAVPPQSHTLYSQYSTLPSSTTIHDEADIYSSTDDLLDPIARSRKPNARLSGKKIDPMEVGL